MPTLEEHKAKREARAARVKAAYEAKSGAQRTAERRADAMAKREKACKDVDLVAKALKDPDSLSEVQRLALLGGSAWIEDAYDFLSALDRFDARKASRVESFQSTAMGHHMNFTGASPQLCKFTLCDWRIPPDFEKGQDANAAVEVLYEEQLRLEREEDPLEKARAAVRSVDQRRARYNASKMLAQHQVAAEAGRVFDPSSIENFPKRPPWMESIWRSHQDYGFIIYESKETYQRPPLAKETWMSVFNEKERRNNFTGYTEAASTMFAGGTLRKYMLPNWVDKCPLHQPSEADPVSLRRHFGGLWDSIHAPKPRILRDTFLVLADDCIFPQLDSYQMAPGTGFDDRQYLVPLSPSQEPKFVEPDELPTFYLWAYDANWQPPCRKRGETAQVPPKDEVPVDESLPEVKEDKDEQGEATCTCNGHFAREANTVWADEDGYEGRVKVSIRVLFSWFYYARLEGYDMKQLWHKAQTLPHQIWACRADDMDNREPGELI